MPGGNLELKSENGGSRYHLDGKEILPGALLEVKLPRLGWILGYFSWSGRPTDPPCLRIMVAGDWMDQKAGARTNMDRFTATLSLPPGALLRWAEAARRATG